MAKRKLTPAYLFFTILFLPDTWQVIIGIAAAYFVVPVILKPDMGTGAMVVLYVMCAAIGYVLSAKLGKWVSNAFKRLILKDKIS